MINKTIRFVTDEQTDASLSTLLDYLQSVVPTGKNTLSDAIRFAIITKAADIRMDARKAEIQPASVGQA